MSPNDIVLKTSYLKVKHWYKKMKSKATIYEEISHIFKRRLQDICGDTNLKKTTFWIVSRLFSKSEGCNKVVIDNDL